MKRFLFLILTLSCILSLCACGGNVSAVAENRVSEEKESVGKSSSKITFRGNPFGSNYTEIMAALSTEGIECDDDIYISQNGSLYAIRNHNGNMPLAGHIPEYWSIVFRNLKEMKKNLQASRISEINCDIEDCVLTGAHYEISGTSDGWRDCRAVVSEFVSKLSVLYGDPEYSVDSILVNKLRSDKYTWIDGDVKIELLFYDYFGELEGKNVDTIKIDYTWSNGGMIEQFDERLDKQIAEDAEKARRENLLASDLGGL